MIVPSMTLQEIHEELFADLHTIHARIDNYHKDFKRRVLKASKYPYAHSYDCYTTAKKNLFIVTLTTLKRGGRDKPLVDVYGIYTRPEGKYAASLNVGNYSTTIYPPHFFKRYRERIVKNQLLSNSDIIKHYFRQEWGYLGSVFNKDFEAVYHSFEGDDKDDKISFLAVSSVGYRFGLRQGNINLIKTIISEENLFENQKPLFEKLKNDLKTVYSAQYGTEFSNVDLQINTNQSKYLL